MSEHNPNKVEHEFKTINAKPVKLKKGYRFFIKNPIFLFFSTLLVILIKIIIYYIYGILIRGLRVKNQKHLKYLKKNKHVLVSNHIHPLDAIWIGTAVFPRRMYVTMLQSNLGLPVIGKILRLAGGIPIPESKEHMLQFLDELNYQLEKKTPILVMPEAALKPYHVGIRKFLSGAFRFAVDANADILPFVYVYKKPKGIQKLYRKKPLLEMHILEPVKVIIGDTKHQSLNLTKDKVHQVMRDYFNKHSDLKEEGYEI